MMYCLQLMSSKRILIVCDSYGTPQCCQVRHTNVLNMSHSSERILWYLMKESSSAKNSNGWCICTGGGLDNSNREEFFSTNMKHELILLSLYSYKNCSLSNKKNWFAYISEHCVKENHIYCVTKYSRLYVCFWFTYLSHWGYSTLTSISTIFSMWSFLPLQSGYSLFLWNSCSTLK